MRLLVIPYALEFGEITRVRVQSAFAGRARAPADRQCVKLALILLRITQMRLGNVGGAGGGGGCGCRGSAGVND